MISGETMHLYWFIGGPWNNRLVELPHPATWWRVAIPGEHIYLPMEGPIDFQDVKIKTVEYRLDCPLPTGVNVLSCLWN